MSAFLRASWILWVVHLRRILWTKRTLIVLLGCLVPPTLAWFVLHFTERGPTPIEAFLFPGWYLVLQLMVPLAAVILGSAVVSEEVDDRTITYLLTRPIPRPSVLVGRWLATLTILLALVGGSVTALAAVVERRAATYVPHEPQEREVRHRGRTVTRTEPGPEPELVAATEGGELPEGLFPGLLAIALLGATTYSALFAAIGTFNRYPMIVGLGYCFAIEGFLANLPGTNQAWTIQYYLRSFLMSRHPQLWSLIDEIQMRKFDDAREAVITLVVVLLLALAGGSLVLRRKQYVLSA
jgi:hypothetical protein